MKLTIIIEPELLKFVNNTCILYAEKLNKIYYSKEDLIQECELLYYKIVLQDSSNELKLNKINNFKLAVKEYMEKLISKGD
jgi:hypothetical protein